MRQEAPEMRALAVFVAFVALALPKTGNAQLSPGGTPPPQVTASDAAWQFNSEPMLFAGLVFYPTRETRFFDPMTMTQVGVYRGVPIYADVTKQPYSVTYVPIGRGLMRAYEINPRRDIAADSTASRGAGVPVATSGAAIPPPMPMSTVAAPPAAPAFTHVESIPAPRSNDGVWLEYDGRRWYSDGPAAVFSPERFAKIGEYRGFAVYRDRLREAPGEIWVEVVQDGPVAPYTTR
jgi:hypothetical protein